MFTQKLPQESSRHHCPSQLESGGSPKILTPILMYVVIPHHQAIFRHQLGIPQCNPILPLSNLETASDPTGWGLSPTRLPPRRLSSDVNPQSRLSVTCASDCPAMDQRFPEPPPWV